MLVEQVDHGATCRPVAPATVDSRGEHAFELRQIDHLGANTLQMVGRDLADLTA
jgi:hypothetical protein